MSAALILTIGTIIVAILAGLLRERRATSTAVALVGAGILALFVLRVPIDEPFSIGSLPLRIDSAWTILGRSLVINETNRTAVGFLYLIGAFMVGGAWASPGAYYLPTVGLVIMNVVSASLMIRPFLFAAIFVEIAAMGGVLVLMAGRMGSTRGALRLLTTFTLGMIVLLWAGWMIETGGITTGSPEQAQRATAFLALGFAIFLGVPPFHIWFTTASEEAHPFGLAFVTLILQSAGLFFLLHSLNQYAWLRESEELFAGIRIVGSVMILFGSIMAVTQLRFSKMMAYALLADFGTVILAVGAGTSSGYQLAIGHAGARVVVFSLWALGIALMLRFEGLDDSEKLESAFWRYPFVAAAAMIGLFSAGGFPLTAGFPSRWGLMVILAPISGAAAGMVVIGMAAMGLGALRWLITMVRKREPGKAYLGWAERSFIMAGIALCLLMGSFPQLMYPLVVQAAAGLVNLVP
jgi:formate hydrogenlyase subunit 3/multisubunit Na+/H+ antiporter MnhD subunit